MRKDQGHSRERRNYLEQIASDALPVPDPDGLVNRTAGHQEGENELPRGKRNRNETGRQRHGCEQQLADQVAARPGLQEALARYACEADKETPQEHRKREVRDRAEHEHPPTPHS